MIVGIAALLTLLFLGGPNEIFLIEKLEKGVKEYVIGKDRQKEILADLKISKKFIEDFNKGRKPQFKTFKALYKSRTTESADLLAFVDGLNKERLAFQDEVIDYRIAALNKIDAGEWISIIENSKGSADKRIEKELKKAEKSKDIVAFAKTRKTIEGKVADIRQQKKLIIGLDEMIKAFEELAIKIKSINAKENDLLIKKEATKEELKRVIDEMNKLRQKSFDQLIIFHGFVKEHSNAEEWDSIMKSFTKELSHSAR